MASNKNVFAKSCMSPFHMSPEFSEFLFSLGGEWVFTPDTKRRNKNIKFKKPVKLTAENTLWPDKQTKKSYEEFIGSWSMTGCKLRGPSKCNWNKLAKTVTMQSKSMLQFKCKGKVAATFQCIKATGVNNIETCKPGKRNCLKGKDREMKPGKNHPWPFVKKNKGAKKGKASHVMNFPVGWKQLQKKKFQPLVCG